MTRRRRPDPLLPIRLLALDIDGTLVGDDLILRDRTREAVRAAVRRGVSVSLVTGRMASSAWTFAEALRLRDPIVAYQGALIRSMPPLGSDPRRDGGPPIGRLLRHRPLAADVAREAVEWCWEHDLDAHVNHLERFVIRADDPMADDYSTFLGARAELVPDILASIVHPVTKVIAMGQPGIPAAALEPARLRFARRATVTLSHPRFLEFVAPGVDKGLGVRWLARRAGVPLGQVMAAGDQLNDLEMIAQVGHGAAMPSGPAEVRVAARYVSRPLVEEGVAELIEDLVLAGPRAAAANLERWLATGRAAVEGAERELAQERALAEERALPEGPAPAGERALADRPSPDGPAGRRGADRYGTIAATGDPARPAAAAARRPREERIRR